MLVKSANSDSQLFDGFTFSGVHFFSSALFDPHLSNYIGRGREFGRFFFGIRIGTELVSKISRNFLVFFQTNPQRWVGHFSSPNSIHPGRWTWNIQITHLERKMIFQAPMIMFQPLIFRGVPKSFTPIFYGIRLVLFIPRLWPPASTWKVGAGQLGANFFTSRKPDDHCFEWTLGPCFGGGLTFEK